MPRTYLDVMQLPTGIIRRLVPGVLPGLIVPGGNAPMTVEPDPVPTVVVMVPGSDPVLTRVGWRRRRRGRRR